MRYLSLGLVSLLAVAQLTGCDLLGAPEDEEERPACEVTDCQAQCADNQTGSCVDDACRCEDNQAQPLPPGSACACDTDCRSDGANAGFCFKGVCMQRATADCASGGSSAECQAGSRCWGGSGISFSVCWPDCASFSCAGDCDSDGSCVYNDSTDCDSSCATICSGSVAEGAVGITCSTDEECGGDATCYPETSGGEETGWLGGYCMIFDATACPTGSSRFEFSDGSSVCLSSCSGDSDCRGGYYCFYDSYGGTQTCWPGCTSSAGCPSGMTCQGGACAAPTCTAGSCPADQACIEGRCLTVGAAPGQNTSFPLDQLATLCPDLPALECELGRTECNAIVPFDPDEGPGYWDYPLNGETASDQYRSYLRRDLMMLIKYAAAYVDCLAAGWSFGNGGAIGLGDMSEANGDIPGTRENDPGHPDGTHTDGFDIDLGYFQVNTADNKLRTICTDAEGGSYAYHCVAPPHLLDPWRTALYLGALADHPSLRIIGVDGQAGQTLDWTIEQLCQSGWLSSYACGRTSKFTYEMVNEGRGWYYSHNHHFHVSFNQPSYVWSAQPQRDSACLMPGCDRAAYQRYLERRGLPTRRVQKLHAVE